MLSADGASAFLLGRLAQEGRTPLAMLRASPGRWRVHTDGHVLAVSGGRLWLAQSRLLGDPPVASVPLSEVGEVTVRTRRPVIRRGAPDVVTMDIEVGGHTVTYTALDDAEACRAFVAALRGGRPAP